MNTLPTPALTLDHDAARDTLLAHLMRGGTWGHYWTPDGAPYTNKEGRVVIPRWTQWFNAAAPKDPLPAWADKNIYWGVHPCAQRGIDPQIKPNKQRSSVAIIEAVNCVFAEFDGKDTVQPDEYAPFLPADYAALEPGARAEAIDHARKAAFAADMGRYKPRAWAQVEAMPLPPSVVVDSGGGYQAYHLLASVVPVNSDNRQHVADVQAAWVQLVGSDKNAKDLARVLRVPGTFNRKPQYGPDFPQAQIVQAEFGRLYSLDQFEALTEHLRAERKAYVASIGSTNGYHGDTFEEAADALRRLAAWRCDDREEWIRVGMSLKAGLGDAGLELWDQWSRGSRKYQPGDCEGRWKGLRPNAISLGTLIYRAHEDNPKPRERAEYEYEYGFTTNMPDPATLDIELTPEERREAVEEERPRRSMSDRIDADLAAWGYALALSELDDTIEVNGERLDDKIDAAIRMTARNHKYGGKAGIPLAALADQMRVNATRNSYHPVKRYLAGLTWDGKDHFGPFAAHLKDKHSPITYADGTVQPVIKAWLWRWMVGAVAKVYASGAIRAQNPMLVLSGAQNMGKSTLAAWLCPLPDMFLESSINPDSNDHLRYLVTKWIWEVSELGATTRRSDREALKAFLTRQEATFRKPYDHHPVIKPALASFIGTVNPMNNGFLDDPTGSRRFLVAELASIDHAYVARIDRDQLWAQVLDAWRNNPQAWRLTPEEQESRNSINAENEVERPYEGLLVRIFDIDPAHGDWWMATHEIIDAVRTYGDAIFDETRHHGVLGSTLRGLGLERKQIRMGGERVWGYYGIQLKAKAWNP